MNPLGIASSLLGGGFSASSSASNGPVSVGQNFGFSNYSPFAVGDGATATASGEPKNSDNTGMIVAGVFALAALILLRRK